MKCALYPRGRTGYSSATEYLHCAALEPPWNTAGAVCQTALLRVRLAAAAEAACEYAVVVNAGRHGFASGNCERLGFRVAYSKVTVIKTLT